MGLFASDLEAFFYIGITIIGAFIINLIVSYLLSKIKRIPRQQKLFANFIIRLLFLGIIIWLIFEIPTFSDLMDNDVFLTIFTSVSSALSIGLGFAFSGIFTNLVAGMVLFSVRPFEVGDIIKIDGDVGVVRAVKSTSTIIETFDNILVEKANGDVISTDILNYTLNLSKVKTFVDFKRELHYTEDLIPPSEREAIKKKKEMNLKTVFKSVVKQRKREKIHNYLFPMELPYIGFHKLINKIEKICESYTENFGFKPTYHITSFDNYIKVNFRILTFDSGKIFDFQPKFAKEIYSSIFNHYTNSN
jgi:small-conductance mechanosensitive channel